MEYVPEIINEEDISSEQDRLIKEGLCRCCPKDISVFSKTRAWHGSSPAWSAVISFDKSIIAHAGVVDRIIKVGNEQLRVAGIQNVFVLPEYRGQGFCGKVITAAMEEAARLKYDMGLLFCTAEVKKVYAKYGWVWLEERKVFMTDENGCKDVISSENRGMFFPIRIKELPNGTIDLQGPDW